MLATRLAGLALGFATNPAYLNPQYALRWSADGAGLAGGLAYTVEPDFCSKLMPQFEDRSYIWCSYLQSAMLRAFETWSMNHQSISFMNVTDACAAEERVIQCRNAAATSSSDPHATTDGNCTKLCSVAQIFVLAEYLSYSLPARVDLWDMVNGSISSVSTNNPPLATSGAVVKNQPRIGAAALTFNRNQCMYLDSTFCQGMHQMQADGASVLVVFSLVCMPFFACALVGLIIRLCLSIGALRTSKRGCPMSSCEAIHTLTTPIWVTWLLMTLAIVCPYVYFSIAAPCVRCFDFEASFVQAIGQVLGLSDPSASGAANYEVVQPLNSSNCAGEALALPLANPLLRQVVFTSTEVGDGPVMLSPERTRAERCPSLDDLQGLNYLYPTCSMTRQEDPVCIESLQSLGVLRFAAVVIAGIMASFVVIAICSAGSGCITRRPEEEEEDMMDESADADAQEAPEKADAASVDSKEKYPAAESATSSEVVTKRPPGCAAGGATTATAGGARALGSAPAPAASSGRMTRI